MKDITQNASVKMRIDQPEQTRYLYGLGFRDLVDSLVISSANFGAYGAANLLQIAASISSVLHDRSAHQLGLRYRMTSTRHLMHIFCLWINFQLF